MSDMFIHNRLDEMAARVDELEKSIDRKYARKDSCITSQVETLWHFMPILYDLDQGIQMRERWMKWLWKVALRMGLGTVGGFTIFNILVLLCDLLHGLMIWLCENLPGDPMFWVGLASGLTVMLVAMGLMSVVKRYCNSGQKGG